MSFPSLGKITFLSWTGSGQGPSFRELRNPTEWTILTKTYGLWYPERQCQIRDPLL